MSGRLLQLPSISDAVGLSPFEQYPLESELKTLEPAESSKKTVPVKHSVQRCQFSSVTLNEVCLPKTRLPGGGVAGYGLPEMSVYRHS